jgi:zinc D-Ala-D-Ala carboxypeptidase
MVIPRKEMKISKHISYNQAIKSDTAIRLGIDNTPSATAVEAMTLLCEKVIDPLYEVFPSMTFNSFFRSPKLNVAIGGSATSQHVRGEAIDLDSKDNAFNKAIFDYIVKNLDFDQVIYEYGNDEQPDWVHVSFKKTGNRKQVLRAIKVKGKTTYVPYK